MKIILADDHALFRDGMRHLLQQLGDDVTVLEAATYKEARGLLLQHPDADLALIDLNMPRDGVDETLVGLLAANRTVPLVVLSASEDHHDIRRALDAGAMGFIPKSETAHVMLSALRLVLSGGLYVPPVMLNKELVSDAPGVALTPRQRDVLRLLVAGQSNRQISVELGLSEATVKVHVTAIYRTLNVNSRMQAVKSAVALGFTQAGTSK